MSSPSSTSTPPNTAQTDQLPDGFGASIHYQGDKETWRMSICYECGALVPNDDQIRQHHRDWHTKINKALAAFLIEEF